MQTDKGSQTKNEPILLSVIGSSQAVRYQTIVVGVSKQATMKDLKGRLEKANEVTQFIFMGISA